MIELLLGHCPVQDFNAGMNYSATLIITDKHRNSVVVADSFKFAARFKLTYEPNLAMIRKETNTDHGEAKSGCKVIKKYVNIFGFTFYNIGSEAQ